MKIVIVTGSRGWTERESMVRLLTRTLEKYPTAQLYVGDARGADAMAMEIWKALGGKGRQFVAHWDAEGKRAGYLRNERMVEHALHAAGDEGAVCLAFRCAGKSNGTDHTIKISAQAEIQVVVTNAG